MDTLGIEPRASRMLSGCDTTTPCAQLMNPELIIIGTDHEVLDIDEAKVKTVSAHEILYWMEFVNICSCCDESPD